MPLQGKPISPLEAARRLAWERERADAVLRAAKRRNRSLSAEIQAAFDSDSDVGQLGHYIRAQLWAKDRHYNVALRDLLLHVAGCRTHLLQDYDYVAAITHLAKQYHRWIRPSADWKPRTHNTTRQFSSLARHLFARYPIPGFFDHVWFGDSRRQHEWFIHVAQGGNLRTVEKLPLPLTKMMAHHALLAPVRSTVIEAMRWGQVRGLGGSARLADAIVAARLGAGSEDENFWLGVIQFFIRQPMLDREQIGPIVDYLRDQKFTEQRAQMVNGVLIPGGIPQPNLTMKGRTINSLLRQVRAWHRELARSTGARRLVWPPSGIPPYERVEGTEGNQRTFRIIELLSGCELIEEGRALVHCVSSCADSCARGRCAIFSLREGSGVGMVRRITIEVVIQNRRIVQARGRCNRVADGIDQRLLRAWATQAGLTIGTY